jgi:hypothetical protein
MLSQLYIFMSGEVSFGVLGLQINPTAVQLKLTSSSADSKYSWAHQSLKLHNVIPIPLVPLGKETGQIKLKNSSNCT